MIRPQFGALVPDTAARPSLVPRRLRGCGSPRDRSSAPARPRPAKRPPPTGPRSPTQTPRALYSTYAAIHPASREERGLFFFSSSEFFLIFNFLLFFFFFLPQLCIFACSHGFPMLSIATAPGGSPLWGRLICCGDSPSGLAGQMHTDTCLRRAKSLAATNLCTHYSAFCSFSKQPSKSDYRRHTGTV